MHKNELNIDPMAPMADILMTIFNLLIKKEVFTEEELVEAMKENRLTKETYI